MNLENTILAWQFIAVLALVSAWFLAWGNSNKQKEINISFKEKVDLINECNKHMSEIIKLRNSLRQKEHFCYDLEEKLRESNGRINTTETIKKQ